MSFSVSGFVNRLRFLSRGQLYGLVACLPVIGLIVWAFIALVSGWTSPGDNNTSYLSGVWQPFVTIIAIAIGGIVAIFKFQLFRDSEPHLTISHSISHRPIGDSYVHIDVTAHLKNSSRVHVEIRKGLFRLQHIAPASDAEVEALYADVFRGREHEHLQWPTLDEAELTWNSGDLIVEPGESHPETYEFIVSKDVESVFVYTYFHNWRHPRSSQAPGWARGTAYDTIVRTNPASIDEQMAGRGSLGAKE